MQVTVRMINDVSCVDCLVHTDWVCDMQMAHSHLQNLVTCKNHRQEYLKCTLSCQTVGLFSCRNRRAGIAQSV